MTNHNQTIRYRESVVKFSYTYTVKKASLKFNISERTIYYWRSRYTGNPQSLTPQSRKPHHHPNQHTKEELKMIQDQFKRRPHDGLVYRWIKLRERGYTRSLSSLYRALQKLNLIPKKLPNPKKIIKPYEKMLRPGQRVQIDVKYVPKPCITTKGEAYYQFTAIDEYSRYRVLKAYSEHSTYDAADFLQYVIKKMPFPIECVQTDNGVEFVKWKQDPTKANPTLFQKVCKQYGIRHKTIRPYTPRHNGKVERSHRKDNEYFYAFHRFYSLTDLQNQLYRWNAEYNNFPMSPLGYLSPNQYLKKFFAENPNSQSKSEKDCKMS